MIDTKWKYSCEGLRSFSRVTCAPRYDLHLNTNLVGPGPEDEECLGVESLRLPLGTLSAHRSSSFVDEDKVRVWSTQAYQHKFTR